MSHEMEPVSAKGKGLEKSSPAWFIQDVVAA
jgi:hypothetical protein